MEVINLEEKNITGCCSGSSDCCVDINEINIIRNQIVVDFLYLDLNVCTRCQGAESSLDEAIKDIANVLEATGSDLKVNKINVNTSELAIKHHFLSSSTIRVNGCDIQLEYKESRCESCGDLCGDVVDCRVWIYKDQEYTIPPKAMIIEGILKVIYGRNPDSDGADTPYTMPENLRHFYEVMESK